MAADAASKHDIGEIPAAELISATAAAHTAVSGLDLGVQVGA